MELPDAIDRVRGFVVHITYTIQGLSDARLRELGARGPVWSVPLGTGFVINDQGCVVTAKHVLDGLTTVAADVPEGNHFVGVGFGHSGIRPGTFRVIKFDTIATDARNDIALIRLRDNPFAMSEDERRSSSGDPFALDAARLQASRPRDGTAIAVAGYSLMEAVLVTTSGHIASAWSVSFENVLVPDSQGGYAPADVADRYLADVQTNPGNSGSQRLRSLTDPWSACWSRRDLHRSGTFRTRFLPTSAF